MSLQEVLPLVKALPRADRIRLLQVMNADLASEEEVSLDIFHGVFPVWSPIDAAAAAATLMQLLESERTSP